VCEEMSQSVGPRRYRSEQNLVRQEMLGICGTEVWMQVLVEKSWSKWIIKFSRTWAEVLAERDGEGILYCSRRAR